MSFGSAPTPPSPQAGIGVGTQEAALQQQYNVGAQAGSNYNQNNQYGSVGYTQTGTGPNGTPIYTANVNLNPTQQGLLNQLNTTKATAGQQGGNLLSGANYGSQTPEQAIGNESTGIEGELMSQYQAGNQPMQQTQLQQLDTQLRNQGLQPGEPGYDNAMRSMVNDQTLANDTANANFENTAFNQANTMYTQPLQMAESLAGFGSPTSPTSQTVAGAQLQPANLIGATANAQQSIMDQYNAEMAQYSGMMNGLFGIGSDALGAMMIA